MGPQAIPDHTQKMVSIQHWPQTGAPGLEGSRAEVSRQAPGFMYLQALRQAQVASSLPEWQLPSRMASSPARMAPWEVAESLGANFTLSPTSPC